LNSKLRTKHIVHYLLTISTNLLTSLRHLSSNLATVKNLATTVKDRCLKE